MKLTSTIFSCIYENWIRVKATMVAKYTHWRYGKHAANFSRDQLIEYVYLVTRDINWKHWKKNVSADNTNVRAILAAASDYPPGSFFLEVGAWFGRTTCALGLLQKIRGGGKVVAIDNFTGDDKHILMSHWIKESCAGDLFPIFWSNVKKFHLESIITAIKKTVRPSSSGCSRISRSRWISVNFY